MTPAVLAADMRWTLARAVLTDVERQTLAARIAAVARDEGSAIELLTQLAAYGLMPLAYRHLVAARPPDLPPAFAAALAAEFRRHASSRFRFARRLSELIATLQSHGVDALPYKGPVLAVQLYGGYAMRQYGDLDILVRPAQAERALEILTRDGLLARRPVSPAWDRYLRRTRHSYALYDSKAGVLVELHWAVADRFHGVDLDVDWLMEGTDVVDLLGRPTKAMGGERLLVALCVHGFRHLWERAAWLGEVTELVRIRPDLDWANAFERADRCDFGRAFRASLILARDFLQAAPPSQWSVELDADPHAGRLARSLAARISSAASPPDRLAERFRLGYLARTTMWRRLTFCWRVATHLSERDIAHTPAPPRFAALSALRRGLRLTRKARVERRAARR